MNNDYVQQLEEKWKASIPRFTPQFLRDTFPKAWENTIPLKIKELEQDRAYLKGAIKVTLDKWKKADKSTQILVRACLKYFRVPQLCDIERNIARLKRLLIIQEVGTKDMRRKVDVAKQALIVDVAMQNGIKSRRSGRSYRTRCMFHDDRTPSLHFYPESSSFYCFGCQKGGDVIQFVQDLLNLTFIEAISYLTAA